MPTIVTLTMNPAIDKSADVDRIVPDKKLRCAPPRRDPGGGGINVSRMVKRLGGDSLAIFPAGGYTGEILCDLLDAEGIQQQVIPTQAMTRESFTAFDTTTEQQYRFNMPGPTLDEAEWRACLDALAEIDCAYVVASGSLPPGVPDNFYALVAQVAKDKNARLILDTSGEALTAAVKIGAYLLKPNMNEIAQLAGKPIEDEDLIDDIAQSLIRDGMAEVMVVSLGAGGALLVTADDYQHVRSPTVPIRSTVGAGDSMVGGMVTALARGENLLDAARWGVASGAATVMSSGTQLGNPDDVRKLYERIIRKG